MDLSELSRDNLLKYIKEVQATLDDIRTAQVAVFNGENNGFYRILLAYTKKRT
ncbi:hypothetical protein BANRA_00513 [Acinetobacter baumannii]|nr:hypothetical protein BANRA_00513 [Acinetobacter baumannii]